MAFRQRERIGRPIRAAGLKLLTEGDLFLAQSCGAVNCCPARRGVPAAQKFLVDVFMARAAIAGGEMIADDESVMVHFVLARGRRVAIEARDVLARVDRHFVFVDDGVLLTRMALGAFA